MNLHWRKKPPEEGGETERKRLLREAEQRRRLQIEIERPLTKWDIMAIASKLTRRR